MSTRPSPLVSSWWFALLLGANLGCRPSLPHGTELSPSPPAWRAWQQRRHQSVAGTNGWATVCGLHWLAEGPNSAGHAPTNALVIEAHGIPPHLGTFTRQGRHVQFDAAPGVEPLLAGLPTHSAALATDRDSAPAPLVIGATRLHLIERGDRIGLRVRDPLAPTRMTFRGLDYFPYDAGWRCTARFVAHPTALRLRLEDVTGGIEEQPSSGSLVFEHDGQEYRLVAIDDAEAGDWFLVFKDTTAGQTTYPSGRFLHVTKPIANEPVVVDFNFAYNPPCAFTAFATCPRPPRENHLPFAISVGERRYRGGH